MSKRDLITKDFALYVMHYFASMETWSKKDILAEIDRKIKEADEDVVRCKDCKYWEKAPLFYDGAMICMRSPDYVTATNEMDFCSYGEKREL